MIKTLLTLWKEILKLKFLDIFVIVLQIQKRFASVRAAYVSDVCLN